jgi:hypothetical protein
MTPEQLRKLQRGDLVRHKSSGNALVIDRSGPYPVGVRITSLTNPAEWDQVDKDGRVIEGDPEPTYTLAEIADACVDAEISSGHFESLEIALVDRRKRHG